MFGVEHSLVFSTCLDAQNKPVLELTKLYWTSDIGWIQVLWRIMDIGLLWMYVNMIWDTQYGITIHFSTKNDLL